MINFQQTVVRFILVILFILSSVTAAYSADKKSANKNNTPAKLSIEQKKQLRKLLYNYRKSSTDTKTRDQIVESVIKLGPRAVNPLLKEIQKKLRPLINSYRKEFLLAIAANITNQKKLTAEEIQKLRDKVLALRNAPNLTKAMIIQQGDPAMKKLKEALLIDPDKLTANDFLLINSRQRLSVFGKQAEKCAVFLAKLDDKPDQELPNFKKYLAELETTTAVFTMLPNEKDKVVLSENAKLISKIDPYEAEAIDACNMMRLLLGLNALKIDLKLCKASRGHSKDMKEKKFFAHASPVPGKKTPWDRAKQAGTSASGENIAMGMRNGNMANRGWWHSPGHHKNMLGAHKRIGMGRVDTHYTELFGR